MISTTPWNSRVSTLEEEQHFQKILVLHSLTDAWIHAVHPSEQKSHQMERLAQFSLSPNLWILEKTRLDGLPLVLHELVGAQTVSEFLSEFSSTVWTIQMAYIETALSQTTDPVGLVNLLQKASWGHGRRYAEKTWDGAKAFSLKEALTAFLQFHFYSKRAFVLSRESQAEISFLWAKSPLQEPSLNATPAVNTLCSLHEEWIRGYFYGLSRAIRMEVKSVLIHEKPFIEFTLLSTY